MPMKREEYTSLVIRANTIATTGGSKAHAVPYIVLSSFSFRFGQDFRPTSIRVLTFSK